MKEKMTITEFLTKEEYDFIFAYCELKKYTMFLGDCIPKCIKFLELDLTFTEIIKIYDEIKIRMEK